MRKQYQAGRFGIGSYKRVSMNHNGRKEQGKMGMRITAIILAVIVLVLLFFSIKVKRDKIGSLPVEPVKASVSASVYNIQTF